MKAGEVGVFHLEAGSCTIRGNKVT